MATVVWPGEDVIMDTRNGHIMTQEQAYLINAYMGRPVTKEMKLPPTQIQIARRPPKVGRNEPCPCGSGIKFKKCCLNPNA